LGRAALLICLGVCLVPLGCSSPGAAERERVAAPQTDTAAAQTPPAQSPPAQSPPTLVPAEVVARFPHDPEAFTEGLIVDGDTMYESVGEVGTSDVRRVNLTSGRVLARSPLPPRQFGEGLARWRQRLITLTWTDGVAHVWNAASLRAVGTLRYTGEGWGLATVGDQLAMSDGSDTIVFRDPVRFNIVRRIQVTAGGQPVTQLNELEWVDGRLLANVWQTPYIVAIDPATGVVTHVIDCRAIVAEIGAQDRDAVLNGIAFDPRRHRLFVTGKLWPTMFEIRVPDWNRSN